MRSRISIKGCVGPSVRPSQRSWISEQWDFHAKFKQNSIKNIKVCHWKKKFRDKDAGNLTERFWFLNALCQTCFKSGFRSVPIPLSASKRPFRFHLRNSWAEVALSEKRKDAAAALPRRYITPGCISWQHRVPSRAPRRAKARTHAHRRILWGGRGAQ